MKTKALCYIILGLFIIVFVGCGDSDDEQETQVTKPKSTLEELEDEVFEPEEMVVDFAAEEAAIRKLFTSHNDALRARDWDEAMEHWLRLEKKEVFMIQNFAGTTTIIEKWSGVEGTWEATSKLIGSVPIPRTMGQVGIDKRGKEATLRGTYSWLGGTKYIAAFRKDKDGNWKIRAIDFCDKGFIKEIKTPKPE